MTYVEQLALKTLDHLCAEYPGDAKHRVMMRACFEIFASQIIFRDFNDVHVKQRKQWYKMAWRWE